jgi:hypothetical protein
MGWIVAALLISLLTCCTMIAALWITSAVGEWSPEGHRREGWLICGAATAWLSTITLFMAAAIIGG